MTKKGDRVATATDGEDFVIRLGIDDLSLLDVEAINAAIGHPLRITILRLLSGIGEMSPKMIVDTLEELDRPEKMGNVAYHVRFLQEKGLIKEVKTTPARGAVEHHKALTEMGRRTLVMLGSPSKDGES